MHSYFVYLYFAAITCPKLEAPERGSVQMGNTAPTATVVTHGTKATFTCVDGYELQGAQSRVCTGSGPAGEWSNDQPTCQRKLGQNTPGNHTLFFLLKYNCKLLILFCFGIGYIVLEIGIDETLLLIILA